MNMQKLLHPPTTVSQTDRCIEKQSSGPESLTSAKPLISIHMNWCMENPQAVSTKFKVPSSSHIQLSAEQSDALSKLADVI
ncbi:hypothetical protein SCA6_018081 [Theobroma cacao]